MGAVSKPAVPQPRLWTPIYKPTMYAASLYQLRTVPRIKAFLDTIAYAEGTANPDGYRTLYSFLLCDSLKDHPRQVICSWSNGQRLCSSAAGRYQIRQKIWDRVAPTINAQTFSPLNQDRVAIELIADCEALEDVTAGRFEQAIAKTNKVWASLSGSPLGQRTVSLPELRAWYQKQVAYYNKRLGGNAYA
jgi:muramidase (phage lysozyme)